MWQAILSARQRVCGCGIRASQRYSQYGSVGRWVWVRGVPAWHSDGNVGSRLTNVTEAFNGLAFTTKAMAASAGTGISTRTGIITRGASQHGSNGERTPLYEKRGGRYRLAKFLAWLAAVTLLGYGGGAYCALHSTTWHNLFTSFVPFADDVVTYMDDIIFALETRREDSPLRAKILATAIKPERSLSTSSSVVSSVTGKTPFPSVANMRDNDNVKIAGGRVAKGKTSDNTFNMELMKQKAANETETKEVVEGTVTSEFTVKLGKLSEKLGEVIRGEDGLEGEWKNGASAVKGELEKLRMEVESWMNEVRSTGEDEIRRLNEEFDKGAKALTNRQESTLLAAEVEWREAYEKERQRLSEEYEKKLQREVETTEKLYSESLKNGLLEQATQMYAYFRGQVEDQVERERKGRLGGMKELNEEVNEVAKLCEELSGALKANMKAQNLLVAVQVAKGKVRERKPFRDELAAVKELGYDDELISAALASIKPEAYNRGIATQEELVERFRRVSREAKKAVLSKEDSGVAGHLASIAMSKLMTIKSNSEGVIKEKERDDSQDSLALLKRSEKYLELGNLEMAAREANSLSGWARVLSEDWLEECRKVLEVRQALDVMWAEARLKGLQGTLM